MIAFATFGCGGGGGGGGAAGPAPSGNGPVNSGSTQVGTLIVKQVLQRSVPGVVTHTRFTGFDAQGSRQYGPVTVVKAASVELSDVPVTTTQLQVEQLSGNVVVGLGMISVTVLPGQTTIITDPPFEDVNVILSTLQIDPPSPQTAKGLRLSLAATGTFTDGGRVDQSTSVSWTSSNPSVAEVDAVGKVRGVNVGTSVVRATIGSISAQTTITVTPAVVTSLTVNPPAPTIAAGTDVAFFATAVLSDGTTQDVTEEVIWTSSASVVGSVDANGMADGLTPGQSTITATLGDKSAQAELTVTDALLTSVTVNPESSSIASGTTQQFRAAAHFSDSTIQDVTDRAQWTTSLAEKATVNLEGLAIGRQPGEATITATYQGQSGTATLRVTPAVVQSIEVVPSIDHLAKGTQLQFTAVAHFSDDTTQNVTNLADWLSSQPSTASVSISGLATGVQVGQVTVSASFSGKTGEAALTVSPAVITSISVTPTETSIPGRGTQQFTAIARFSDSTTQDVTGTASWTSASTDVATITTTGLATGADIGQTTITAQKNEISGSAILAVTSAITGLRVDPPVVLYAPGESREFRVYAQFADNTEIDVTDQSTLSASSSDAAIQPPQQSGEPAEVTLNPGTPLASTITFTASLYSLEARAEIRVNRLVFTSLVFDDRVLSLQSSANAVLSQVGEVDSDPAPGGLAVSPNGIYLYVSNLNSLSGVSTYEIAADGSLTFLSKLEGAGCDKLVLHPNGKYMYGGTRNTSLEAYLLRADGTVELLESEPAGEQTYNVALSPDGNYLYSAAINSSLLWTHRVEENGTLTLVDSQTTPAANPYDVSVSADGTTLVATLAFDSSVAIYDLTTGETPRLVEHFNPVVSTQTLVFDPQGRYAVGSGNFFSTFAVAPLDLTRVLSSTEWGPTPAGPWQATLNSTGEFFFMTSPANNRVGAAKVAPDGSLSNMSAFDTSGGTGDSLLQPRGLAVTP